MTFSENGVKFNFSAGVYMSLYRILAKLDQDKCLECSKESVGYIVQSYEYDGSGLQHIDSKSIQDVKKFDTLIDAKDYKYQLELKHGIVI